MPTAAPTSLNTRSVQIRTSHDSSGYLDVAFDANAFFLSVRKGPGGNMVRYEVEGSRILQAGPVRW